MIILKFVLLHGENGLSLICWHINILDASYVSLQNPKPRIHEKTSEHPGLDWFQVGKVGKPQGKAWKFREVHWVVVSNIYFLFSPLFWGRFPFNSSFFRRLSIFCRKCTLNFCTLLWYIASPSDLLWWRHPYLDSHWLSQKTSCVACSGRLYTRISWCNFEFLCCSINPEAILTSCVN